LIVSDHSTREAERGVAWAHTLPQKLSYVLVLFP